MCSHYRMPKFQRRMEVITEMATDYPENSNGNNTHSNILNNKPVRTSASQLQTNSQTSTTTTRLTTASSSSSTRRQLTTSSSDLKASNMKTDLIEFNNNMNDMRTTFSSYDIKQKIKSSLENLVDVDEDEVMNSQPVVTFPDEATIPSEVGSPISAMDTVKFEQKTMNNFKSTKVVTDGFSAEKESAKCAEMKKLQAGDVSYEENSAAAATRARLEVDGVSAEKSLLTSKEARSLITGEVSAQQSKNMAHSNMKVTTGQFSAEQTALATAQQRQTVTNSGFFNQEKHSSSTHSVFTTTTKGIATSSILQTSKQVQLNGNIEEEKILNMSLDDLDALSTESTQQDIEKTIDKYSQYLDQSVKCLQRVGESSKAPKILNKVHEIMLKAWSVPTHGHELGFSLCKTLRKCGGLDLLISYCTRPDIDLKYNTARLLEQCLTTENREYVVKNGLEKVVNVACACTNSKINANSVEHSRVGTGILEHLFKHSEETCSDVVRLGGLDALLFECRKNDVEILRHCAGALANLSLYGGTENQEAMIKRKVPMWLFPLAFHADDNIKYYACLAISVLVANAEIEAEVLQSGTLGLVEPFVTSHNPSDFAKSNLAHAHGQNETWLKHLVPVLNSKREEARNLAAFHFCMEAGIKKGQGNTKLFKDIGATESLKLVASCPNAVASKYAAQALRLIGEVVPHKLSQQVPLWSFEDVAEWVKQIGFEEDAKKFFECKVDGDLLLQLTEDNLKDDVELTNGIKRKRFTRELQKLKKMADYSSRDTTNINSFLQNISPELSIYTYNFLNAGVENKDSLIHLSEDQLLDECRITNSIHRFRIMEGIRQLENGLENPSEDNMDKTLDVFISYRRSNGSQLASLLKVHLQLRGFSVFIDVERLEAGKFDNNLLQSIQKAKHFLLVLTPFALDRCKVDCDKKDWVHREIVAALQSQCNIIPITDSSFGWPEPDELPEDMRQVCHFNGVRWIHDYQDACVDKLERFMRGELNTRDTNRLGKGDITPGTPSNLGISRNPPIYQRTHSNDSGGNSDKDFNGNSGHSRGD
ncbi:hypothetical protein WA026_022172 [Henosepilachna vigintioctopunctata]|uniref:ADP-ribosyl cyclase/cyclic ADP-ribose hydrolase n=1 Tax=Henosepilachna vigintioctopunctata TaxID=420089 RepID=A0AAW1TY64_9CUCU